MNPMTNVKNVKKLSELELKRNLKTSWHDQYKNSAWIFIGGLPYDLTEGDVICVFSQYGEVVNLNLVREKGTGKSKGFCFLCYEDQRSTVLAVDNLNGIKVLGRTIRVDHVSNYKPPKDSDKLDDETRKLRTEGCASTPVTSALPEKQGVEETVKIKKEKKDKSKTKSKKKKKKRKKKKKQVSSSDDSSSDISDSYSDSDSKNSEDSEVSHCNKKHKHRSKKSGKKRKKKSKVAVSDSDSSTENETIRDSREKRRKLVEKIKTLEAVLNYTRKASKKASEEHTAKARPEESATRAHDESQGHKSEQRNHYQENGTSGRDDSISRRPERASGEGDHEDRRWKTTEDGNAVRVADRSRDRFRPRERDWDYERDRVRERERFSRDRDRDKRWERSYERGHERYRK
ncbi:RNA-binding motif protein, X-linked 2-like [Periplaneta americana]|uniref:RNA-binding motif protein, X-linked 2-like n=1 Tax=Periplaneta americana TaxID=6978 RepID=UPI0037E7F876